MDISGKIFPIKFEDLTKRIRKPGCVEFYEDHFFTRLVHSILEHHVDLNDSLEILAIRIPDGDPVCFHYVFNYLINDGNFITLPIDEELVMIDLLKVAAFYQIDGLKQLILNNLKLTIDEQIKKSLNLTKKRRIPIFEIRE